MAELSGYVEALVREREGYTRDPRRLDRVFQVDAELKLAGWVVDDSGKLVNLRDHEAALAAKKARAESRPARERAVAQRAPETAVPKD